MAGDLLEKHLVAGMDERERGFSRPVEIVRQEGAARATFRYETLVLERTGTGSAAVLAETVRGLQERGYRQLRTRLTFLDGAYLGSQELWIAYADPEPPPETTGGWAGLVRRIRQAFMRRS